MPNGLIGIRTRFDPQNMLGVIDSLRRDLTGANPRGLKRGYDQAGTIYLQFLRRRYQRLSRGGGVWARLRPATVRQKHGNSQILVRTGRLFGSLLRGSPDCVFAVDAQGLTIGTMVPYARFPQNGQGRLKRQIYVRPDPPTRQLMQSRLTEAVNRAAADAVAKHQQRAPRPAA